MRRAKRSARGPIPELLKQWFAPLPYTTPHAELDVRPGGSSLIVMRGPDGNEFPNRGVYLEVVPNERLVFTDAFTKAWEPSEKPFMTVVLTFEDVGGEDEGGKTDTPLACFTGLSRTGKCTRRWVSMKAGASAPTNSRPSWRKSDAQFAGYYRVGSVDLDRFKAVLTKATWENAWGKLPARRLL